MPASAPPPTRHWRWSWAAMRRWQLQRSPGRRSPSRWRWRCVAPSKRGAWPMAPGAYRDGATAPPPRPSRAWPTSARPRRSLHYFDRPVHRSWMQRALVVDDARLVQLDLIGAALPEVLRFELLRAFEAGHVVHDVVVVSPLDRAANLDADRVGVDRDVAVRHLHQPALHRRG